MIWNVLLAEYDAETTTFSACAGALSGASSPYTPTKDGTIKRLRCIIADKDAATLINHVEFRLKSSLFGGVDVEVGVSGNGLQTVPATPEPSEEWVVDLPVKAGVPIVIEGRNITSDTPVTVSVLLYATIEG